VIADAKYALSTLFEDILRKQGIRKNKVIAAMIIPRKIHTPRNSKYSKILDIGLLFDYYRDQPPNETLTSFDLMIKAAILILAFSACRSVEVVKIIADKIKYRPGNKIMLLPTFTKQRRHEVTNIQLQSLDDIQICPVAATARWLIVKKSLDGGSPSFLLTKSSRPLVNAQLLAAAIKEVFKAAHIPPDFKPYSIKHAAISALYELSFSSAEVNIFTGHSELAETAPTYYLRSFGKWPGLSLATKTSRGLGVAVVPNPSEQI
jgi:integrase